LHLTNISVHFRGRIQFLRNPPPSPSKIVEN
jgi:hypothetical protein